MDKELSQESKKLLSIPEYFSESRSGLYSVLVILPLILIYQLILWFADVNKINGADYLLQNLFKLIGVTGMHVVSLSVLIAFFVAFIYHLRKRGSIEIHARYLVLMLLESAFYAFLMYILIVYFLGLEQLYLIVAETVALTLAETVALTLSSGVYEELVFRVIILSGLIRIFRLFWGDIPRFNFLLAAIISSLIFSYFHFVGSAGQIFIWINYFIYAFSGMMLAIIYFVRGFGIAVFSHTIFNAIVLLFQ